MDRSEDSAAIIITTHRLPVLLAAGLIAVLVAISVAIAAAEHVSGTVGDDSIDGGADFPASHLRYVGNPAPAGYSHSYQWAEPVVLSSSPEDGPVVISGTVDLADLVVDPDDGTTAMIGLADFDALAAGDSGYQTGAYIYLSANRTTGDLRVGVTDGNAGGEIVQTFITIPAADIPDTLALTFTIDGTADPAACATGPSAGADGCLTLELQGDFATVITDSYGSVNAANGNATEFQNGGYFGWEAFPGADTGIDYDLTIDPVVVFDPASKEACKDGGWEEFGFANQGQCILFVNTGRDTREQ